MKFNNGQWLLKNGYNMKNPVEVRDVKIDDRSITIFAPFMHVEARQNTIDQGLMTIKFSSPMDDIIRVQVYHHKGFKDNGPQFNLDLRNDNKIIINNNPKELALKTGNLSVKINRESKWAVNFFNKDEKITGSKFKYLGYMTTDTGEVYMREQLDMKIGEYIYGLGERFSAFVKNGQSVDIWNEDGGTESEQAYKNIPFYITNKGYGVFVNHTEKVSFEVASESVSKIQFSVPGEYLDYFIINGPSIKKVIENYTNLTGKPSLPPIWSFGLWLSTSFTTSYDEETVNSFIDGMISRDIPISVFHFDCFWMKEYHLTDFQWDNDVFPYPEKMIGKLKEKGLKICLWINPYIAQRSSLFDEGVEKGYLIKKINQDVWQWDRWQAGMAIVDFTNPEACKWYKGHLKKLIKMGVDCFKTDFGERIPTDVVYFDGSDPLKMHNYYSYIYNKVVFETLEEELGKGNAILFARSATAGCQKFPLHWGGDSYATYESIAHTLRSGLSLGLAGFGFWSHDIGGFENAIQSDFAPAGIYKRWIAFGLLSSHSRLHGSSSYRVPWIFDEESVGVLSFFTKLKYSLMPYLFAKSCESVKTGIPVLRAMIMEFQDDPGCDCLERQYMLGESLLVAPVLNDDGTVNYYLPDGIWTNFFTNEKVSGSLWRKEKHDFMSLPLMVRENSIIAVGNENTRPDYNYANDTTFHVFELQDGKKISTSIYDATGKIAFDFLIERKDNIIIAEISNASKNWSVLLRSIDKIKKVSCESFSKKSDGILIKPEKGVKKIILELY